MGYVQSLLAKNEEIAIQTRQHWRVLVGAVLANGFLFLILIALVIFGEQLPIIRDSQIRGILILILLGLSLLPLFGFFRELLEWWNEEYIVTNRRVIQAQGILGKHVIDSSLDKVNDVVLTQSFLGRLFDYGDIEILTASEVGVNLFRTIAAPVKFKMAMMNQRETMAGRSEQPRDHAAPDAAELLQEIDELHKQGVLTDQEYQEKKKQLLGRMKIN